MSLRIHSGAFEWKITSGELDAGEASMGAWDGSTADKVNTAPTLWFEEGMGVVRRC
jgi:hypothetical protein